MIQKGFKTRISLLLVLSMIFSFMSPPLYAKAADSFNDVPISSDHETLSDDESILAAEGLLNEESSLTEEGSPDDADSLPTDSLPNETDGSEEEIFPNDTDGLTEEDLSGDTDSLTEEGLSDDADGLTEEDLPSDTNGLTEEDLPDDAVVSEEEKPSDNPEGLTDEADLLENTEKENLFADSPTVIYNLQDREITVGYDISKAEAQPLTYKLFDKNGNYVIQLEDNAFFPYEVQFTYDELVTEQWFDTPDSTVQIGGHTFSVYSEQNDDTKLSHIGVWVGDNYIAARPKPKTFTNTLIKPFTLLPIYEYPVYLDLTGYSRFELSHVQISAIINNWESLYWGETLPPVYENDKVVWAGFAISDPYHAGKIVEQYQTIDLLNNFAFYDSPFTLEMIVGSAKQLDPNNIRYLVDVYWNPPYQDIVVESVDIYTEEENGNRKEVEEFSDTEEYNYGSLQFFEFYLPAKTKSQTFYAGITINSKYSDYNVQAVEGYYDTANEALAAVESNSALDISSKILDQSMSDEGSGWELFYDLDKGSIKKYVGLIFYDKIDKSKIVGFNLVHIELVEEVDFISYESFLYDDFGNSVTSESKFFYTDGIGSRLYTMFNRYPADAEYSLRLQYTRAGRTSYENRQYIEKAVVGHYDSLEDAKDQPNIKDELFPENALHLGYKANYSGDGQKFTIFTTEGFILKSIVIAEGEYDPDLAVPQPKPNPGFQDIYFRVEGAKEIEWHPGLYDGYTLSYLHDSYYDMGYQTVFYFDDYLVEDDGNESTLTPVFWANEGVNVYASAGDGTAGTLQESGKNKVDFANGSVQYSVVSDDNVSLKNYWVTFVKHTKNGAKLFVNGINGEEGAKREVFLTTLSRDAHDIFIANIGDQSLTNLKAELIGAKNIKLDPYWTVGGDGNNTLSALSFDEFSYGLSEPWDSWSMYGELPNMAKIRLISDGEGEVSGTLRISADGEGNSVDIELTGSVGDPKLSTEEVPEAVKYVPYAAQILHNNKYSWNEVAISVVSGQLPEGVVLRKNGELYGVPTEQGEFTFTVQMVNSDKNFSSSTATYTLVVHENTNENVYTATDEGYEITTHVGTPTSAGADADYVITDVDDYEFVTEGEFDEFIDFWLDGVKLVKDEDYTAEDGSTKVTIRAQTFNKAGEGQHTIAAEFRSGNNEDKELKRAAQNYNLTLPKPNPTPVEPTPPTPTPVEPTPPPTPGGGGGGSSSSSDSSEETTPQTKTPEPEAEPEAEPEVESEPQKQEVTINGREIDVVIREDGIPEILLTEEDVLNNINESGDFEINISGYEGVSLNIPSSSLEEGNIVITTDFGNSVVPNDTLKELRELYGDTIRIEITKGSFKIALIDENGEEIAYNNPARPFVLTLPYTLKEGQRRESVVAVKKNGESNIIQKRSIYKNGSSTFAAASTGIYDLIYNHKTFGDIEDHWAVNSIFFTAARELFYGTGNGNFTPNAPMTRAMFATLLARMDNADLSAYGAARFHDVSEEQWYTAPIGWISSQGIMNGVGNGEFSPNAVISREQIAIAMSNYIAHKGHNLKPISSKNAFADDFMINPQAKEAIESVQMAGIINGKPDNRFDPQGIVTRAEAAAIFMNFLEALDR